MGRRALFLLAVSLLVTRLAHGFHEGGANFCEGCHGGRNEKTLRGPDPSSTCLRCHAENGFSHNVLSSDGSSHTPGGDFYWLTKSFSWTDERGADESPAERHGHNVVASEYGLTPDAVIATAPGGSYHASDLGCTSCHDPHATTGSADSPFRLLGGLGYRNEASPAPFSNPQPVAVGPPDGLRETDRNHTAYGFGMSEWCANCHWQLLSGERQHPSGPQAVLKAKTAATYNGYVRTGDQTGKQGSAYLALVPFEAGTTSSSELNPSSTEGPKPGTANVMCLTCHRAHGSAFRSAGRWDFRTTFLADSHPRSGDRGASMTDQMNSYYGRDIVAQFGRYQRQLCNKCHLQD